MLLGGRALVLNGTVCQYPEWVSLDTSIVAWSLHASTYIMELPFHKGSRRFMSSDFLPLYRSKTKQQQTKKKEGMLSALRQLIKARNSQPVQSFGTYAFSK